jgi:hypothetical protein
MPGGHVTTLTSTRCLLVCCRRSDTANQYGEEDGERQAQQSCDLSHLHCLSRSRCSEACGS